MPSPEEIIVESREGGSGGTGSAIGEEIRSKEFQDINDLKNLGSGASNQGPLILELKEEEDTKQNEIVPGDGQVQEVCLNPEDHPSRSYQYPRNEAEDYFTDFVKKRDEDLSITLVVAGLFSAVTSAFIVYIHPQLQPDSNEETAGLLRVILYQMDNATFGGSIPKVPRWTGPPRTTVATQVLLYLSLAATLGSVLFAILAKQLLNLYALAGSWGSNVEHGRSQQRRLKWFTVGLHVVVLALSLLLQLALLLLSCALSVYLWNINTVVASVVLTVTLCAVPIYSSFGILALANLGLSHFRPSSGG
ncbi:hypothetical protein BDM02DRAFT_3122306 [Thelephora ganbajun]|uniref:Uncharacterized protein n=1 Tax=Thelephora ganbajun TaxID=370292 RepID=A0ACB6Z3G7_THEGA|nr:hypothetical protein BDM02DRAFT_3122306 [Thelephora ganbajun]